MANLKISNSFTTGQEIPRSGIYCTVHMRHPVRRQVALLRGRVFPGCPKCLVPVRFDLLRALQVESAQGRYRLLSEANTH